MIQKLAQKWHHTPHNNHLSLEEKDNTRRLWRICLILAISVAFFLILAYRIDKAPDIHLDEIIYYRAAFNLATEGEFAWHVDPVFVHPPLQFMSQALFLRLTGLADTFLPFAGTYSVRLLNALAAAITVAMLFHLIERLGGWRAALITLTILILDPFVVRINRRNYLETMTEMWVVIGLYFFWRERDHLNLRKMLFIGTIFGLGFLTKELAIFGYAVIPLFVILAGRWRDLKKVIFIGSVALLLWSLFPFWAWSLGRWDQFIENKTFALRRLLGFVQISGWNRPEVSFVDALSVNLSQYITSYSLILIGFVLMLLLFFTWRDERGRFVLAWVGMMYLFCAYLVVAGTLNDQFFYYLMVPVITTIGTMVVRWVDLLNGSKKQATKKAGVLILTKKIPPAVPARLADWIKRLDQRLLLIADWLTGVGQKIARHKRANSLLLLTVLLGLLIQSYNTYRWITLFAIEEDNALHQLSQHIQETIPAGSTINSMDREMTLGLMLPEYKIVAARNPTEIQAHEVEYAILSSKNLWARYGDITPDYYEWVEANGQPLFKTYGNTFWHISLYRLELGQ